MAQTTVKDFAKTLKISEEALLKRMSSAGLSHSSKSDEVTTAHKQILLRSLKQKQKQTSLKATRTILRQEDKLPRKP